MSRQKARDRWMEAVLGARLRFHARSESPPDREYWSRVYRRWAQLHREAV